MTSQKLTKKPAIDRFALKTELVNDMLYGRKTLGEIGRTLRSDGLQMSQTEVCQLTGLSRQVVSDIENDTGNPRLASLRSYFKLLGLELAVLPRQRNELTQLPQAPTGQK
ncbi:helix-turn-helix transcriptional regulator [Arsukibacterium sp.]|uniref:helix-turn-helix domain-containing protein n=1 Tax=Arsukibacterium sp. TaxID=1977258 RepID=UPI00299E5268|nr:helix-turn-helix transcriptional regulator [Arsukibacterium sp.]MDX1539714.1 helix-turn-helix transcriptional regulator [Arsukibacterium sp.]